MTEQRHNFRGELVLFDDVTAIFGFEEDEKSTFLHMEKERLQDELNDISDDTQEFTIRFDLSGNRLDIGIVVSSIMNRLEIVNHVRILTNSLIRIWEWVLINYDTPDASTLMQIKNVSYAED